VAWDNADTHEDDEVEEVVRARAGAPGFAVFTHLQPVVESHRDAVEAFSAGSDEIRELFETKQALLAAAQEFFERYNQSPEQILSVIGSKAQKVS
jgi:hypothetical protein